MPRIPRWPHSNNSAATCKASKRTTHRSAVTNDRVRDILKEFSGQDFGPDQQAWEKWAVDLKGYAVQPSLSAPSPPPTIVEQVPIDYQPQAGPPVIAETANTQVTQIRVGHSCFGAGTRVRTLDGSRPIEEIREGDPILTQNTTTGALSYQPVVVAYHNPPNATFRIELDNETIVATGIHRFWKAGKGWVMARELKPGDRLRTVGGIAAGESRRTRQGAARLQPSARRRRQLLRGRARRAGA